MELIYPKLNGQSIKKLIFHRLAALSASLFRNTKRRMPPPCQTMKPAIFYSLKKYF